MNKDNKQAQSAQLLKIISNFRNSLLFVLRKTKGDVSDPEIEKLIEDVSDFKKSDQLFDIIQESTHLFEQKNNKKQTDILIGNIEKQENLNLPSYIKQKFSELKSKLEFNQVNYAEGLAIYFSINNLITDQLSTIRSAEKGVFQKDKDSFKEGTEEILASDLVIASRNMGASISKLISKIQSQNNDDESITELAKEAKELSFGRAKFFGGLDVLSRVTDHVMKMHDEEQEKFKTYFVDIQSRLEGISDIIGVHVENDQHIKNNEANFQDKLNNNLESLKNKAKNSTNINELKNSVFSNIENLEESITEFKTKQKVLRERAGEEIKKLNTKINTLTQEQIQIQEKLDDANRMILYDDLTGIFNRCAYRKEMEKHYDIWKKDPKSNLLNIGLIDIDHFKKINDDYGHDVGDVILKEVALRLRKLVGPKGTVFRWGGEEFAIIYPDITLDEAVKITKSIRVYFEKYAINVINYAPIKLTISGGLSCFSEKNNDADLVAKQADNALYYSKNNGRNKIAYYGKARKK